MPKISVIIPTHSRPHLLPRSVNSAREAGEDVEIIVVDDASTDETAEVCKGLEGIKYIRVDRNQRVAGARNIGILNAQSDYISFLDDDDERLPDSLNIQVEELETQPEAGLSYGQVLICDQNGIQINVPPRPDPCPQGDIFWKLLESNFIPCQSVVFRKTCLSRIGLLDPSLDGIDDWDLWLRITELYPVVAIEKPVAIWRTPTPISGQGSSKMADLVKFAVHVHNTRWLKLPRVVNAKLNWQQEVRRRFLNHQSDMLIWNAQEILQSGYINFARKNLLTALQLTPFRATRLKTIRLLASSFLS